MSLVESIPLQKKIAELEARIEKLEKSRNAPTGSFTRIYHSQGIGSMFGEDWDKMWEHFHKVMKKAFNYGN